MILHFYEINKQLIQSNKHFTEYIYWITESIIFKVMQEEQLNSRILFLHWSSKVCVAHSHHSEKKKVLFGLILALVPKKRLHSKFKTLCETLLNILVHF